MTEATDYSTGPYAKYSMHLSRALIDNIFHYSHYIPNVRGWTQEFFDRRYPGWGLEPILEVFEAAGIVVKKDPCGMMGKCHWRVAVLHFNSATDFEVEWNDSIHEDDGKYFWNGPKPPREGYGDEGPQTSTGSFLIATDGLDFGDPDVQRAVADHAAERLGVEPGPKGTVTRS